MNLLVLYVLGRKGFEVLETIVSHDFAHLLSYVVIGADKGVANDYRSEIQELCDKSDIKWVDRLKEGSNEATLQTIGLAVGWRWIIDTNKHKGLIIIHDSLLPKYRGFAPLVSQLINGETVIGATAIFAVGEFDRGDIIFQESVEIKYPIKIHQAIEKVAVVYSNIILRIFQSLAKCEDLPQKVQDENEATYSVWRDAEDFCVHWNLDADRIKRFIDATGYPFSGAFTHLDGRKIILDDVVVLDDVKLEERHPGKALFFENELPVVICGSGLLRIHKARWSDSETVIEKWPRYRMRFQTR